MRLGSGVSANSTDQIRAQGNWSLPV